MKKYRLKNTGEEIVKVITSDDSYNNLFNLLINAEVIEEVVEYPIGTRVHDSFVDMIYTKEEDGRWYKPAEKTALTDKQISRTRYTEVVDNLKKKDYQILKMTNTAGNLYDTIEDETVFAYLEGGHSIYSVKRIRDNKIFTIGDTIIRNPYVEPLRIEKIIIDNKNEIRFVQGVSCIKDICSCSTGPKQETFEEASKNYIENTMKFSFNSLETKTQANRMLKCAEFGAKWQAKRMYSEKDIENIWNEFVKEVPPINNGASSDFLVYLKQFKKK